MAVVEAKPDGVSAHRLYPRDVHLFLADLKYLLTLSMPAYLRGGRVDPQILARQVIPAAVVESELEHTGFLMQLDVGRANYVLRHDRLALMAAGNDTMRRPLPATRL